MCVHVYKQFALASEVAFAWHMFTNDACCCVWEQVRIHCHWSWFPRERIVPKYVWSRTV